MKEILCQMAYRYIHVRIYTMFDYVSFNTPYMDTCTVHAKCMQFQALATCFCYTFTQVLI